MKRTIFEISEDLRVIEELLTANDGDISDEAGESLEAWFDALGAERDAKIDQYCWLIEELTSRAKARADAADRLMALVKTDQNALDRMKRTLHGFFTQHGISKLETTSYKLTVAKNGGKAPLLLPEQWRQDAASAPEQYHERVIRLNTEAIRADAEAGIAPEGVAIGERGTHLRIK